MGFLTCCFNADRDSPAEELVLSSEPSLPEQRSTPTEKRSILPHHKSHITDTQHTSVSTQKHVQVDSGMVQALQLALGGLEGDGFEARSALFVSTVQEHLGPSAVVRLYGLTSDDGDPHVLHLVQLAAKTGRGVAGPRSADDELPGRSYVLSAAGASPVASHSMHSSGCYSLSADRGEAPQPLLLEQAMSSKKPATFRLDGASSSSAAAAAAATRGTPPAGGPTAAAEAAAAPWDCAVELGSIQSTAGAVAFAAVPLSYGKRLLGALWMAVAEHGLKVPNGGGGGGGSRGDDSATAASMQAARSQALLANRYSLEQLGLSASMALALAAAGDVEYVSWLAGCVRRLAGCTNLHTLVAGVCSAVSRHVRMRFHADVAVQSALVPEPDSQVAFMLCPETKAAANSGGGPLAAAAAAATSAAELCQRPKSGVISKPTRRPVRRVASQVMLQPWAGASDRPSQVTELRAGPAPGAQVSTMGLLASSAMPPPAAAEKQGLGTCSAAHSAAYRDGADGPSRMGRNPGGGSASAAASAPVLFMSAKAFQLSHTLLSRLVGNARSWQPPPPVPTGVIVVDTARHVADVRQPSRDVCMLIGSKAAMAGAIWQQGSAGGAAASAGVNTVDQSGGRASGPASLLLLAMEVAEGGCMLGLYVAFPTLMPPPLLAAARDSCEQLLRQVLADLVRHKLQTPELGPDLDTLRAGIPGSYVSVSRVRDHVDRLQLPMASPQSPLPQAFAPTANPAGAGAAGDRLEGDLSLSRRMAAWNTPGPPPQQQGGGCGGGGSGLDSQGQGDKGFKISRDPHMRPLLELDSFMEEHHPEVGSPRSVALMAESCLQREETRGKAAMSPLPAAKLLLARGSWAHHGGGDCGGGGSFTGTGSNTATPVGSGQACMAQQVHYSASTNQGAGMAVSGMRTPSFTSGLPSCGGVGSQGAVSTVMLDSNGEPQLDGRFGPAAMMTVHAVDDTWGMRGMMGALVESIMTTLRVSASEVVEESMQGTDLSACRSLEGLEDLHLAEVLGHGASGVVLRGTLGTVPVAVKLMEMPDADYDVLSTEVGLAMEAPPLVGSTDGGEPTAALHQQQHLVRSTTEEEQLVKSLTSMANSGTSAQMLRGGKQQQAQAQQQQVHGEQPPPPPPQQQQPLDDRKVWLGGRQQTESEQVRARRTMLRNATELAVMRLVSHVCIVQAFAVYDNVVMERTPDAADSFILRRLDPKNPETGGSPICTAIVQELCDCGSLADVLASRSFPTPQLAAARGRGGGTLAALAAAGGRLDIDMRGVYLTLLEIALALRHLHARKLVHRDVKPANILLKTSPGDPRGWTCKLADFGFALVLEQQDKVAEPKDDCSKLVSPGPAGPIIPGTGSSSGAGGRTCWYTIQAQASGTVTHMAPEAVVKNSRIDASVDIYSLGIIFWELVCGRGQRPFRHLEPAAIPAAVVAGMRPVFTPDVPAPYRKMAQACWAQEPHRRPRAADVVNFIKAQLAALNG